tara:strand:- start:77 stop:298 length:222 start_codon:yes stop_codon:yes gene_type:complete
MDSPSMKLVEVGKLSGHHEHKISRNDYQEEVVTQIERLLNDFLDDYNLTNEDLKKILHQIITDIDRGFVGEAY